MRNQPIQPKTKPPETRKKGNPTGAAKPHTPPHPHAQPHAQPHVHPKKSAPAERGRRGAHPPAPTESRAKETQISREKKSVHRMIFANEAGYSLAVIAEDNRITDFWILEEQRVDRGTTGNVYRGVVAKVVPALNAAFIDIGLEKDGFLSFDDLGPNVKSSHKSTQRSKHKSKRIDEVLHMGDSVLVQIAKEPIADKGPSLTGKISLPGRFLVYMPYTRAIRMSRMLSDAEKKGFHELVKKDLEVSGGIIFRTASKGRDGKEILHDLAYLTRIWKRIEKEYDSDVGVKLIHKEIELFERVLRDNYSVNIDEIVVDHPRLKYRIDQFLNVIAPRARPEKQIKFHDFKERSIWSAFNLVRDIDRLFSKYVYLDCGGYIIIEEMETLTAIDVNTGKNVAGKTQDQTILETNLEAAQEIPRQLRLRQIGGIIVIDFIDMRLRRDQDKVFKVLERELAKDRTPSDIQQFTDLGLIQVTRQRSGKSLSQRLTYTCPHCNGSGRRPSIALG